MKTKQFKDFTTNIYNQCDGSCNYGVNGLTNEQYNTLYLYCCDNYNKVNHHVVIRSNEKLYGYISCI